MSKMGFKPINKTKIGIVGNGILGKALDSVFKDKFEVFIYDKYKEQNDIFWVSKNADLVFICVPTPMKNCGGIDLSCVEDSLRTLSDSLKEEGGEVIAVLRSTIIPGTTDSLQKKYSNVKLVFNPEFLTEKNFIEDMKKTNKVVLGSEDKEVSEFVEKVYRQIFPDARYILTNAKTAEMIKYSSNISLASQVIVANELYQICEKSGVDYNAVKEALLLDNRIGKFLNVPGHDGDFGFGGKCFPKDLNALIMYSKKQGYSPELLEQVWKTNLKLRKNKDWEKIKGATSKNCFESID